MRSTDPPVPLPTGLVEIHRDSWPALTEAGFFMLYRPGVIPIREAFIRPLFHKSGNINPLLTTAGNSIPYPANIKGRFVTTNLSESIVELVNCGVFALDRDLRILAWNRFMQSHSGRSAEEVIGLELLEVFPELPREWLKRKVEGVFVLGTPAYSSWEHRPFLFHFEHSRPITGPIDAMRQNCSFIPIEDAQREVTAVAVTIVDATDVCIAYGELQKREQTVANALAELTVRNSQLTELNDELAHAHQQLLQSEKLAAIGQLAAGVAHESNNPVGFVLSNLTTLEGYIKTLIRYAEYLNQLVA